MAGNVTTSPTVVTITVDTQAPATPVILSMTDDVGSIKSDLLTNQSTDDTLPKLNGTGVAGSTVTLYDGTTPVGSVLVPADGNWSIQVTQPLSEGPHTLTAVATDAAGNASTPASFALTIDTTPPAAPIIVAGEGLIGGATLPANGGSTKSTTLFFLVLASREQPSPLLITAQRWVAPPSSLTVHGHLRHRMRCLKDRINSPPQRLTQQAIRGSRRRALP